MLLYKWICKTSKGVEVAKPQCSAEEIDNEKRLDIEATKAGMYVAAVEVAMP
ncbi:hypothetical protein DPMN_008572 [Dreissena polymorpha]|uniref:Uncharacterized protein n=1 Tax=Dreissena polymorpha TaxID=45954 RepID=A0A9D4MZK6_DREPO|nr:hypothetical protein DPMN_008572 [Dreissena polymorpha]